MKRYILPMILIFTISIVYGISGFSITMGEATYNNPEYKKAIIDYLQSKTDRNIKDEDIKVIKASEVNRISKDVTGKIYNSSQVCSCAMVDLNHDNLTIIVDQNKIKAVTPQMYANSLKSAGIEKGYVVVSSPLPSTGETALLAIFKSYETIRGIQIPDEVKKASLEELYLQTRLVNETGEDKETIAQLISEVKNKSENINDPQKIKKIVIKVANNLKINLTNAQIEDISKVIINSQKAKKLAKNHQKNTSLEDRIYLWLQSRYNYLINLLST
ncbi:MAG TPA: DUF1002 domain-containing protein [Methanothermobacter sp.]|nr:conserved hypothetical protein [Methanothermobacter sp. MT-2]HHW05447.1 DUF1002 domain-containing protein [Methanothermobacter sp.]HOK73217.1 DUF1002 domain-containing protein [Methanothermobacter sp.]HOL68835.1 DUF1002 domain-containing protein [Methanothermobacter sp.]HPQ04728.1 DUF1002 domain-containing protein [Methanothermobacter sp.]